MNEPLLVRIHIIFLDGGNPIISTDKSSILTIGLPEADLSNWNLHPISIGSEISLSDRKVRVVNIRTELHKKTFPSNENLGVNMFGIGKEYSFNVDIFYEVEKVK